MTFEQALERLHRELPGWWWSAGECFVSCDAHIAPDRENCPDAHLLKIKEFDDGFDGDLLQPSTVADAMCRAIDLALIAKQRHLLGKQ